MTERTLSLSLLVLLLLGSQAATAQTISNYCIFGSSTGVNYAWALDLGKNGVNPGDPIELNAPAPAPGAGPDVLAQVFSASIAANATAVALGVFTQWLPGGTCFNVAFPQAAHDLWVAPAGVDPGLGGCNVGIGACSYNPTIVLVDPNPAPTLNIYGFALAGLALVAGGWLLLRRRAA